MNNTTTIKPTPVPVSADEVLTGVYALEAVCCHEPSLREQAIGIDTEAALRALVPVVAGRLKAELPAYIVDLSAINDNTGAGDIIITVAANATATLTSRRIADTLALLVLEHTGRHFPGYARAHVAYLKAELDESAAAACPATRADSYR